MCEADSAHIEIFGFNSLLKPTYHQFSEAVQSSDVCEVQSALQPLAIPFDDSDLIEISEKIAASESDLHASGTHVFSDRMLNRAIERLSNRIDVWAHELVRFFFKFSV